MSDIKVLVIGNGSSTKDYKFGNKIDDYDIVVRFNRGYFQGIKGYEEYIGKNTDILVVHDGFAKPEYLTQDVFNSVSSVLVAIPNFKFSTELQRINSYNWGDKVQVIPHNYELELRDIVDFGNKWPTAGLFGLYTICKNYEDITLYGFDGHDKKYEYYHYFDKEKHRTTKHAWRDDRIDHNLNAENECMQKLISNYKLKNLINE